MYGWGSDDAANWHGSTSYKYDSARAPYLDDLAKEQAITTTSSNEVAQTPETQTEASKEPTTSAS